MLLARPRLTVLLTSLLLLVQGCASTGDAKAQAQQAAEARARGIQSAAPPEFSLARQRTLAAVCATCHGTEGRPPKDSIIVPLAALPRGYMAQQLRAFRDGARPSTVMQQITLGLTDAEIEAVAFYFSTLKR
ncbi:c-type cytochrome [Hylemonella gracilis]|uniref:Cytochrome c553-like protein n=1 Tax=Hylemonella gracilis ATCC 19624 TaxID=887062 RepID=F3KUD8_9BURK|nr:c-type cytochrome [Hylemonella gracilis]EGI76688.1 cytochrome c553-like protein [Hylemonella gracilis ATCC 19624]